MIAPQGPHQPLEELRAEIERMRAKNAILISVLSSLVKVVDANIPRDLETFKLTLDQAKRSLDYAQKEK